MAVHKKRSGLWPLNLFFVHSFIPIQRINRSKPFISLIRPEDTTEIPVGRYRPVGCYYGRGIRGFVKALFWIAVSLVLSILIGQLS